MRRHLPAALLALCALGPAAFADVNNDFRLDLSFAARVIDADGQVADVTDSPVIGPGETVRLELRYRIADLAADGVGSRGLCAALIRVRNDAGPAAGSVKRSRLTLAQANRGAAGDALPSPVRNPDSSGDGSVSGLMDPFRGGLQSDSDPPNGLVRNADGSLVRPGLTMRKTGFEILPIRLTASDQTSFTGLSPQPANTDSNPTRWGVFSFDYTAAADFTGDVTFNAEATPGSAGERFSFFVASGSTNRPAPVTSVNAPAASVTVRVRETPPAPPALASQPSSSAVCGSGTATFSVAASGPRLKYQWQIQTAPDTWRDLSRGALILPCGGRASATPPRAASTAITIEPCRGAQAPRQYAVRCVVRNPRSSVTSDEASYLICPADFNCSGSVTTLDLHDYLSSRFAAPAEGDSGTAGLSRDIREFVEQWLQGCG